MQYLYEYILSGLANYIMDGDIYSPVFTNYIQSLKPHVINLRKDYRKTNVDISYNLHDVQSAYMIAYYPSYVEMAYQILNELDNLGKLKKLKEQIKKELFEKKGELNICIFAAGAAPEAVALLYYIKQEFKEQVEKNLQGKLIINTFDIDYGSWATSRYLTKQYILPKIIPNLGYRFYESNLLQEDAFKAFNKPIKKSRIIFFQNFLNEVSGKRGRKINILLSNLQSLLYNMYDNSLLIISDLSKYSSVERLLQKINKRNEEEFEFDTIFSTKNEWDLRISIPSFIKNNLLTCEDYLIPRQSVNYSFIGIYKKQYSNPNCCLNPLPNANLISENDLELLYVGSNNYKNSIEISYSGKNFSGKCFTNMENLKGANFSDANLKEANFSGTNLTGANFSRADLTEANFSDAKLREANFTDANLKEANFTRAKLREADLIRANLIEAKLTEACLGSVKGNTFINSADLTNANLRGADLTEVNLKEANLRGVNFREADLSYSNLTGADLTGSNLSNSCLLNVNFSCANLSYSNLTESNLSGTDFELTNLESVNFINANFSGTKFIGANLRNANFRGCDVKNASFCGSDLSDADLNQVNFSKTSLTPEYFANTQRNRAKNYGIYISINPVKINFANANLKKANFSGIILEKVNFSSADLRQAYFIKSKFDKEVNFSCADLREADFTKAELEEVEAIFNGADLRQANLTYTDLEEAYVHYANLKYTKLLKHLSEKQQKSCQIYDPIIMKNREILKQYNFEDEDLIEIILERLEKVKNPQKESPIFIEEGVCYRFWLDEDGYIIDYSWIV